MSRTSRSSSGATASAPAAPADGKVHRILTHCVYQIATGRWAVGQRLPSAREAEALWGVDRRTVLKAYRLLETTNLVECRTRSGFRVRNDPTVGRVSQHRHELRRLFDHTSAELRGRTDLSVLGTFRYFASLAEMEAREAPELGFAECTLTQAAGHCAEIEARLDVPCCPLNLAQLGGRESRLPTGLRTLFVSRYHLSELGKLADSPRLKVVPVTIHPDPMLAVTLEQASRVVIVEFDATEAEMIAKDVQRLCPRPHVRACVVADAAIALPELIEKERRRHRSLILLAPRVWGHASVKVRQRPGVGEARFVIHVSQWPQIADAAGLPLGIVF